MKKVTITFVLLLSFTAMAATGVIDRIQRGSGAGLGRVLVNSDGSITVTNPSGKATTFSGALVLGNFTVAGLPAGATGKLALVTDGSSASDCTAGGGSTKVLCLYNGSAYVAVGGATPAGSDTQLQRNNAGAFGAISGCTSAGTNITCSSGNLKSSGTNSLIGPNFTIQNDAGGGFVVTNEVQSAVVPVQAGKFYAIDAGGNVNVSLNLTATGAVQTTSGGYFSLSSSATQANTGQDTFMSRQSAGTLQVGTASNNALGHLSAASVRGNAVAFASLPVSPVEGMLVGVSDSNTATWGATIAGGGANHVLAYYNGTNWTVAAK
jgi:hypothetical protein